VSLGEWPQAGQALQVRVRELEEGAAATQFCLVALQYSHVLAQFHGTPETIGEQAAPICHARLALHTMPNVAGERGTEHPAAAAGQLSLGAFLATVTTFSAKIG
jgi:hypothetical protein